MGKILKPAGGKRSAVMSYTKHYYIGSERISAKTGTCVNTGYYPQGYLATKMPDLDENLVRTPSDDKVGRAGESIYYVHEKFGLNPPALSSTQDYVEESSSFNHMRNELDYFYFHPDHLGSSSYITNAAGTISQHMEYLPFGELLVDEHTNSYNSPFKYNGKEFDEETGNYFYGARYYDPKWSIFISVDPLAEKYPSVSPYTYCLNNPIIYIDPDGRDVVNGETAKREKLEGLKGLHQQRMDEKYNSNMKLSKKDFSSKQEYKEYKSHRKSFNKISKLLDKSIKTEAKIQTAIDDFKSTDPTNFDLVDNLTFKDSNGTVHDIDVIVNSGKASNYGGAVTKTSYVTNADGTYNSIHSITTTLDFSVVKPTSHVLAHEMGHAYNNAQNPAKAFEMKTSSHNCQDPANRNTFQSKIAMDWQQNYDALKRAMKNKK